MTSGDGKTMSARARWLGIALVTLALLLSVTRLLYAPTVPTPAEIATRDAQLDSMTARMGPVLDLLLREGPAIESGATYIGSREEATAALR